MGSLFLCGTAERRQILQRLETGPGKVGPPLHRREGLQSFDRLADRSLGNFVFERAVLISDDRVALVAELVKVLVVRPDVLSELELADEARAANESGDPAFHSVLRSAVRKRRPISPPPADHPAAGPV